jgi:hypothetical protein
MADADQQQDDQQQLPGNGDDDGGGDQSPPTADELTQERFDALRAEVVQHRRKARAAEQVADELRAEAERRRQESESEQERTVREAVEAERERLTAEFATERLQNRLRARAAGRLADPEDAVTHLAGTVAPDTDDAGIDQALADLLEHKPYLSPANGEGERGQLVTQGVRSQPPGRTEQSPDAWIRSHRR